MPATIKRSLLGTLFIGIAVLLILGTIHPPHTFLVGGGPLFNLTFFFQKITQKPSYRSQ
jgi:hypothetical protein